VSGVGPDYGTAPVLAPDGPDVLEYLRRPGSRSSPPDHTF